MQVPIGRDLHSKVNYKELGKAVELVINHGHSPYSAALIYKDLQPTQIARYLDSFLCVNFLLIANLYPQGCQAIQETRQFTW